MKVENGDIVSVNYTGSFDDGEIFDSSKHGDHSHPLEFEVGGGQVIKGFDKAVLGMKEGEKKKFRIKKEEDYGERIENLTREFPRSELPKEINNKIRVGMMLNLGGGSEHSASAMISKIDEKFVTFDLNHPMAGKDLNFEIEVIKIIKKN